MIAKVSSRLIGTLFLVAFPFYGVGFSRFVTPFIDTPDFLSTIPSHQTIFVIGVFMMLLNTVVDIGKGVLLFPILENRGKRTVLTFLAALVIAEGWVAPDPVQHYGLPDRPDNTRSWSHIRVCTVVPDPAAPAVARSVGLDWRSIYTCEIKRFNLGKRGGHNNDTATLFRSISAPFWN
jgi:hypothetical protein